MSEFSESYHLRGAQADGVALLERAGVAGWVFPDAGGWCAVLPERDFLGDPQPEVIAANQGLLVFYVNAEDHGWGFSMWDGTEAVASYEIEWTEEVEERRDGLDLAALRSTLEALPADRWSGLEAALATPTEDDIFGSESNPGHRFASTLGLSNFEWMSGHYLARDGADDHRGLVRVDAG